MNEQRSYLTKRFLFIFSFWQLLGIMSLLWPILLLPYLIGLFLIGSLLLTEYKSLPRNINFMASLSPPQTPQLGQSAELTVELQTSGYALGQLARLTGYAPSSRLFAFKHPVVSLDKAAESHSMIFRGRFVGKAISLGFEEQTRLGIDYQSWPGLWSRYLELEIPSIKYRVVPCMKELPHDQFSRLIAGQRLLCQGTRRLLRGQTVDQFRSVRKYCYPDSIRHIDQKKTAKFGELMTRVYDSYHSHHLILALDLGRAMCGAIAGSNKHDYYLSACLALARYALQNGDRVSFLAFSRQIHYSVARSRNFQSFHPLFLGDIRLEPREEESDFSLLSAFLPQVAGQRAIVIVLSDFSKPSVQHNLLHHLQPICRHHLSLAISLLEKQTDLETQIQSFSQNSFSKSDLSRIMYCYWLNDLMRLFSARVSTLGGSALSVSEDYWMATALQVYILLRSSLAA